jgi:hypothetical protein
MSTNKKTSLLINRQVPDFVRDDYPNFVLFLEAYYEFLDNNNYGLAKTLRNISDVDVSMELSSDIDDSLHTFEDHFFNSFLPFIPKDTAISKDIIIKNVMPLLLSKGSEKSYMLLFRMLFDTEVVMSHPSDNILRASAGKWSKENVLRVMPIYYSEYVSDGVKKTYYLPEILNSSDVYVYVDGVLITNYSFRKESKKIVLDNIPPLNSLIKIEYITLNVEVLTNSLITSLTSGATAIIEKVGRNNNFSFNYFELFLNTKNIIGSFNAGETLKIVYKGLEDIPIYLQTFSDIGSVQIIDGGAYYNVGDPVIISGGTNDSLSKNATAIVDSVAIGNIEYLTISDGGVGFQANNIIEAVGYDNTYFDAKVLTVDTTGDVTPNTATLNIDLISTYANTSLSAQNFNFSGAISSGDWVTRTSGTVSTLYATTYGNGVFIYSGLGGVLGSSTNAANWSLRTSGSVGVLYALTYGNSIYVYGGSSGVLGSSINSSDWTLRTSGTVSPINALTYGNGIYVYAGNGGVLGSSVNATNWTLRTSGTVSILFALTYGNGIYVYAGNGGVLGSSVNATSWTLRTSGTTTQITTLTYGNGIYVYGGPNGLLGSSTNAIDWTLRTSATVTTITGLNYTNGIYVYVGTSGALGTSSNANNWTAKISNTTTGLNSITSGLGLSIYVGLNGILKTSSNAAFSDIDSTISTRFLNTTISNLGSITNWKINSSTIGSRNNQQINAIPSTVVGNLSLNSFGIIGKVDILNAGQNYQIGQYLTFANTGLYTGQSANLQVSNVSVTGGITKIKINSGGISYQGNTIITLTSTTGTNAMINIAKTLGDYENIIAGTTNKNVGQILSVKLVDSGYNYASNPTINMSSFGDGGAILSANLRNAYLNIPGRWTTSDGKLSNEDMVLQGRDYFVDFTYVLSSQVEFSKYKSILKNLLHPSGLKLFSRFIKANEVNTNTNIIISSSNTKQLSGTVNITSGSVVVQGTNTKFVLINPVTIIVNNEIKTVSSITSNTSLNVSSAFINTANNQFINLIA